MACLATNKLMKGGMSRLRVQSLKSLLHIIAVIRDIEISLLCATSAHIDATLVVTLLMRSRLIFHFFFFTLARFISALYATPRPGGVGGFGPDATPQSFCIPTWGGPLGGTRTHYRQKQPGNR